MSDERMALQELLEKTPDAEFLRRMIGFAPEPAEGAAPDGVGLTCPRKAPPKQNRFMRLQRARERSTFSRRPWG